MPFNTLPVTTLTGNLSTLGKAYGQRFATAMVGFARYQVTPTRQRLAYAKRCWKHIQRDAPQAARFMNAAAQGAHLSIEHVTLLALHEEIQHAPHCTAFVATGQATRAGRTLNAQNWDWNTGLYPWAGLLHQRLRGAPAIASYHYPGLWCGAGVNEAGMSLMWTGSGYMSRVPPVDGVPAYALIAEVLLRENVADALDYLRAARQAGCYVFFLADRTGNIAVVEAMPGRLVVDQSSPALSRANHYLDPGLCQASKQDMKQLTRKATSCVRAQRMAQLVQQHHGKINLAVTKQVLADRHGPGPWIHQWPYGAKAFELANMTVDSLIADCNAGVLHAARGGRTIGPWTSLKA